MRSGWLLRTFTGPGSTRRAIVTMSCWAHTGRVAPARLRFRRRR